MKTVSTVCVAGLMVFSSYTAAVLWPDFVPFSGFLIGGMAGAILHTLWSK